MVEVSETGVSLAELFKYCLLLPDESISAGELKTGSKNYNGELSTVREPGVDEQTCKVVSISAEEETTAAKSKQCCSH